MAGNLFLRQKLQSESADAAGADDRTMTMAAAAAAADLLGSNQCHYLLAKAFKQLRNRLR